MKTIANIAAAILILFGILFIVAATDSSGSGVWFIAGLVLIGVAFGIILVANRRKPSAAGENVTLKVDLPGNVKLDQLKCRSCGGSITAENIKMVAGAPVVSCPYCGTSYQMTEEPKW